MELRPVTPVDVGDLTAFLRAVDLTVSGVESPTVRIWIARHPECGSIYASTGFELSTDGQHALIRSVAVDLQSRRSGLGTELAEHAISQASKDGARHAWLFSRRSGPFWQRLGFRATSTTHVAIALADTEQVKLFTRTGQLRNEAAWHRPLSAPDVR